MGGRRRDIHEGGNTLAIRTDLRGKGVARDDVGAKATGREAVTSFSRSSSLNSLTDSADEQVNTHLSASSAGDTLSSQTSAGSTARTSAMTDEDRPHPSTYTSPSQHAHPHARILELTSDTASSSALPDTFGFDVSRKGNFIAVYTASNIWLIKADRLPRLLARTLEVKRKPVAVDLLEDCSLLAVLSRPSQVDLYELPQDGPIKKRRTISLVHEAHSMVVSPDGLILITGNKFGIEVVSIGPDAPESCRRTLSGPVGDSLQFSDDGRTLLITGYARKSGSSSMFILPGLYDGPLNEEGVPVPASPEAVWTGLVLFPETTRIARQATLLPDADTGHVNELFAFNADEDTWGIYDIAAQRFTQRKMFLPDQQRWTRSEFLDDAMPAVSPNADLAAVSLRMRGMTHIWVYQVPEWDFKPKPQSPDQSLIQPCEVIPIPQESLDTNLEIGVMRWVKVDANVQRLVAIGTKNNAPIDSEGPNVPEASKGVVIVLDFDKTKPVGAAAPPMPKPFVFELDSLLPGERLPEGSIDFEQEVELVRTRTLAQRREQDRAANGRRTSRGGLAPGRAHTTTNRERPTSVRPPIPSITRDDSEEMTLEEAQAAFEMPYDNTQPRSQNSLARAATVAAVSPANRRHLRALPFRPLEYRRADGLREFPHESDADNWVPPPPAYTATAEASQSVSLSHPDAPPVPQVLQRPGTSTGVTAVPPLSTSANPAQLQPTNPYQQPGGLQSMSSTDLPLTTQDRRPSLVHPSTYPSPLAGTPGRRRSSATQGPQHQLAATSQLQNQSAYQATANIMASARRPTLRGRRAVESTVDLRSPPAVAPPMFRRGSAPDSPIIHRRPVPVQNSSARASIPHGPQPVRSSNLRRAMLPRLMTPEPSTTARIPMSAPPRTSSGGVTVQAQTVRPAQVQSNGLGRPDTRLSTREKKKKKEKKIGCIVM